MVGSWWCVAAGVVCVVVCVGVVEGQANRCFKGERLEYPSFQFPRKVEKFGLDLFRRVAVSKSPTSVFISPYSIWSALVLAYLGSSGATKKQLETALHVTTKTGTYINWNSFKLLLENSPKRNAGGAELSMANWAYFSTKLDLDNCLDTTLFELKKVNFTNAEQARAIINEAVSEATRGLIPELIEFLPPATRFALVNAIYFKGKWELPFRPEETRRQEFLGTTRDSTKIVDMMVQEAVFKQGYSPSLDARIIELPYQDSNISMFVFLPSTLGTDTIINNLSRQTFDEAYQSMSTKYTHLIFPRFKMTNKLQNELKQVLYDAGIEDLFVPGLADLTAFTRNKEPLNVDEVIHQATVEITEEGTVAAAATALLNTRFGGPPPDRFAVNRPFVFLIMEKLSGITLFAGNILNPNDFEDVVV